MTNAERIDIERRQKYLRFMSETCNVPDYKLEWLDDIATTSFIYNTFFLRISNTKRFDYWFDVIKDVRVMSDIGTILAISVVDNDPYRLSQNGIEYTPGIMSDAIHKIHDSGNMDSKHLLKLLDFSRLVYNIDTNQIHHAKWYGCKWLNNIIHPKGYDNNTCRRLDGKRYVDTMIKSSDMNNLIIADLVESKISIDAIIYDVDFMQEYMDYLDCSSDTINEVRKMISIFNELIEDYELFNQKVRSKYKIEAQKAGERMLDYIESGTNLGVVQYWEHVFHADLDNDKKLVKKYFPDIYGQYIEYINKKTTDNYTRLLHTIINKCKKLDDKFDNLYNISLLDYVLTTGDTNPSGTVDFIVSNTIDCLSKYIKPLMRVANQTKYYISYEDEMKSTHIIKDHELTVEEKQKIFDYMDDNKYPHWNVLFTQIAKAYIEGTIEL